MNSPTLTVSRASLALRHSPIPALRKLELDENDDVVIITGNVSSYYLKQLAQETVLPALDGRSLVNRVAVVRQPADRVLCAS